MSSQEVVEKVVNTPPIPPGKLGKSEIYALGLGTVIGVGVISLVGPCIAVTGYSVWLAYLAAVVLGFISLVPYIFVSSTFRVGGGIYSYVAGTLNYRVSGMLAITFIPTTIGLSGLGTVFGIYINSLFPQVSVKFAGVGIILLFFILNLMKVNFLASIQKYATWFLLSALLLFTVVGLFKINYPEIFDITADNFMSNGAGGFRSAIGTLMYSTVGYSLIMTFGRDAKDAKKDIPWAYVACAVSLLILYVGIAIVATGVLPIADVSGKSLTYVAKTILPAPLFIYFIVAGPIMAVITTINASMIYYQIPYKQSCQDGWLPKSFDVTTKNGVCLPILLFSTVMGVLPQLMGFKITTIINNLQLLVSCMSFVYFAAFFMLPKKHPEAWKKARLHIPDGLYYLIVSLALCAQLFIFVNACMNLSLQIVIVSLVAMIAVMVYGFVRAKSPMVQIKTSMWD